MTTLEDFKGRSALITGAASGIGAACAKALGARGAARLWLVDVDAAGMDALDLPGEVHRIVGSVADEALWQELEPRLAGLDNAIVNAGIGAGGPLASLSLADWRRVMAVNLDGAFLTLATSLRAMAGKRGSVVITASTTGLKPVPGIGPYGVSKAAVAHMARIAAAENAAQGIRVNAIAPGEIDTAILSPGTEQIIPHIPLHRLGTTDEVAKIIYVLCTETSSYVNGAEIHINGGQHV